MRGGDVDMQCHQNLLILAFILGWLQTSGLVGNLNRG